MSGPSVYFTLPTTFKPWPESLPLALPPPVKERSFRSPFGIEKGLFNFALRPEVPFIFASTYIILIFALNAYNKSRDWKPWWIAKQKPFQWFVVVHNVLLALYSTATFAAIFRAIVHSWPGLDNSAGAAGIADALCKLHGPRGMGDAATFNTTINIWEVKNTLIKLGYDGNPDPTDVGRLWNEGLAFWGWLFYVSKFYEVIDTLIVLSKGKRSATLQTYHHAGAMLCMWAGIRYMSPPIWMFVFVNSAIHAMMYVYFTASALGYKVPQSLKRTLTSLQIAQFVFGASYAALHLFVQYDVPISTPYQIVSTAQRAVSSVSSAVSSVSSGVSDFVESPIATASLGALLKKLLLRAAGEEGVAERIRHQPHGSIPTPHIDQKMADKIDHFNEQVFETRWHTDWTKVNCIDTSGEAFAIYLNLLYLLPLTWLFGRFFVRAYSARGRPPSVQQAVKQTAESAKDGEHHAEEAIEEVGERVEDELAKRSKQLGKDTSDLHDQLREDLKKLKEGKFKGDRRVSDRVASFERQVKSVAEKAVEQGKAMVNGRGSPERASPNKPQQGAPKEEDEEKNGAEQEQPDGKPQKEEPSDKQDDKENQPPTNHELSKGLQEKQNESPDESRDKQDENTEDSQAANAEPESQNEGEDKEHNPPSQDQSQDALGEDAEESKQSKPDEKTKSEDKNGDRPQDDESTSIQKSGLGDKGGKQQEDEPEPEDTDAMGKSGSIIDLSSEKTNEAGQARDENEESGKTKHEEEQNDAVASAERSGVQEKSAIAS